jgi:hypothetical protein
MRECEEQLSHRAMLSSDPALVLLAPWLWNTLGSHASVG